MLVRCEPCEPGWDGSECQTDVNECDLAPCAHGSCSESSTDAAVTIAAYLCICEPGWIGSDCDQDIDECNPSPCLHGGDCTDSTDDGSSVAISAYACTCAPGYEGATCEIDSDECASDPCLNDVSQKPMLAYPYINASHNPRHCTRGG